ncbi:MAG TPA: hypothetical protein VLH35_02980 [Candidatus Acidoferrales bacterium]|nr:hypothetical protein [Candidatus Acidoferrales bacterium]
MKQEGSTPSSKIEKRIQPITRFPQFYSENTSSNPPTIFLDA